MQPTLKRSLSLPLVTFYGIGTILGAGIYVLVGKVAGAAGMQAPFAFLLASLLILPSAFLAFNTVRLKFALFRGEKTVTRESVEPAVAELTNTVDIPSEVEEAKYA